MTLKPQDVLILLKLVALRDEPWTYNDLATELDLSPSQVHAAVRRAIKSELAYQADKQVRVHAQNLEEFLGHGLRYLAIPERGAISRGMATLTSAPPFAALFVADENPIVWPDSSGDVRGESLSPIYKSSWASARKTSCGKSSEEKAPELWLEHRIRTSKSWSSPHTRSEQFAKTLYSSADVQRHFLLRIRQHLLSELLAT